MSPLRVRLPATPGGQEGCPGAGTLGKGELCCPAWPPSGRPCPARGSQGLPEVTEKRTELPSVWGKGKDDQSPCQKFKWEGAENSSGELCAACTVGPRGQHQGSARPCGSPRTGLGGPRETERRSQLQKCPAQSGRSLLASTLSEGCDATSGVR